MFDHTTGGFPRGFFFDPDPAPPAPPVPPQPPAPALPTPPGDTFTQDQVNSILKKEREKHKTENEKTLEELRTLRDAKGQSDEARATLSARISELEDTHLSDKDKAVKERKKLEETHTQAVNTEKQRADQNWQLFTSEKKRVAIASAAIKSKAFNVDQISAIVESKVQLVEIKEDDKVIGYNTIVPKIEVKDDKGNTEVKDLTVEEFVETMKGDPNFANLFVSDRQGGTGYVPGTRTPHIADASVLSPNEKIAQGLRKT